MRIATQHGFSCESESFDKSYYYRTEVLRTFYIGQHHAEDVKTPYATLGDYVDALGIELPAPLTSVRFGGNFAVTASQIYAKRSLWDKIAKSLEQGDNIEEGHYVERIWDRILSYPMNDDENAVMQSVPTRDGEWGPFTGQIHVDE